jgi:hypothetical protein
LNKYDVLLQHGDGDTTEFQIKADGHRIDRAEEGRGPDFISFYRDKIIKIVPTVDGQETVAADPTPAIAEIEVFRAPLPNLLAIILVADDEDTGEEASE